jgi:metal-dependent amidase/aminoacylase/carboxypeptidase family protein
VRIFINKLQLVIYFLLAEEGGGGKVILLERGGYKDMDACVMCVIPFLISIKFNVNIRSHPGPGPLDSTGLGTSLAIQAIEVEYFGHT